MVCLLLCKEESSSPVSLQLLRLGIWACVRGALVYVFLGLLDSDYVSQHPNVWYYVVVESSFKHALENYVSNRAYVFGCLIFGL